MTLCRRELVDLSKNDEDGDLLIEIANISLNKDAPLRQGFDELLTERKRRRKQKDKGK